jgi:hypothetical protein
LWIAIWAEWEASEWARQAAQDMLVVEDILPYACLRKSTAGVSTVRRLPTEGEEEGEAPLRAVESYEIPYQRWDAFGKPNGRWGAEPSIEVEVTRFPKGPVTIEGIEGPMTPEGVRRESSYKLVLLYGQLVYMERVVSRDTPHPSSFPLIPLRHATCTVKWIGQGNHLVEISPTTRNPKEIIRAYLEKHPSVLEYE